MHLHQKKRKFVLSRDYFRIIYQTVDRTRFQIFFGGLDVLEPSGSTGGKIELIQPPEVGQT